MKKLITLTKTLLVLAGLCVGVNAWAGTIDLVNIDYTTTTTPAWTVVGGSGTIADGAWKHTHDGGNGARSAYLDFGVNSSIEDNWTASFDVTISTGSTWTQASNYQVAITKDGATYTNNAVVGSANILLGASIATSKANMGSDLACTITLNGADVSGTTTLSHGVKYTFNISVDGTSLTASIMNGSTTVYSGNATLDAFVKPRGLYSLLPRPYNSAWGMYTNTFDNIRVSKEVTAEEVSTPSIAVAYAGENRTVTITPGVSSESNAVTTYYTLDGSEPTNESDEYTTLLTITENCTIKAISISSTSVSSAVASLDITVGKVTLATPTIFASDYTFDKTNGTTCIYFPTFDFSCDNTTVPGKPTASLSYTFTPEGGNESSATNGTSYSPMEYGTLKVIASAEGYNSSEKTLIVSNYYKISYTGRDYSTATHEDDFTTWGEPYEVTWNGWGQGLTAYLSTTTITNDNHLNIQNANTISLVEGWGLVRGDQKSYGYRVRYAKEGDFIALKENTSKGADATATDYQTIYCQNGNGLITDLVSFTAPAGYIIQQLYHYSPSIQVATVTIGDAGYATYSNPDFSLDFTNSEVKAYTASLNTDDNTVLLKPLTQVPSGNGVVLAGAPGTYDIPVIWSASAILGKLLKPSTDSEIAASTDGLYHYVLAKRGNNVGFYKLTKPKNIGAGKAYLETTVALATTTGSRVAWIFDDGTTGIKTTNLTNDTNETIYNLNGQRVTAPQKGLYIVNGKKVIMK